MLESWDLDIDASMGFIIIQFDPLIQSSDPQKQTPDLRGPASPAGAAPAPTESSWGSESFQGRNARC